MNPKLYDINIFGLSNGSHHFEFSVDNDFFAHFDYGLVQKGKGLAQIKLEKSETLIKMDFEIKGTIDLICDRSLEEFDYPIKINKTVLFKYGEEEAELGEDIYVIPHTTSVINVSQYLYEFIGLEVPLKKLHPRFQDNSEEDELIYSDTDKDEEDSEPDIDPRWESLRKLREEN